MENIKPKQMVYTDDYLISADQTTMSLFSAFSLTSATSERVSGLNILLSISCYRSHYMCVCVLLNLCVYV